MLLSLSGVYSADGVCFGAISIFIAYCLKLANQEEKVNIKQIILLILSFIFAAISKGTGYIFIGLLIFILPIKKILKDNKKDWWKFLLIFLLIIITIVSMFIMTYKSEINDNGDPRSEGTNSSKQLIYILHNPVDYVALMINHFKFTFFNLKCLSFLNAPMFFGSAYYHVFLCLLFYIIAVGITDFSEEFKLRTKIVFIITSLAIFATTSTALYLSYTAVGANHINGYQMRYLFPIIPLILCVFQTRKLRYKEKDINLIITYISWIFILASIKGILI